MALSLLSFNAFADAQIAFTTAEFRVVKVSPMCPPPAPGRMSCMALGGTVTVETTIGCLDKLIFSHFEMATDTAVPTLRAVSVVRADSDSTRVLCHRANTIRKTVQLPDLRGNRMEIINEEIRPSRADISFGSAHYNIVKVSPLCPANPGGASCDALGGKVTVETQVGCLDKVLFSHFEMANDTLVPTIRAVSVVRNDIDSMRVRCSRVPVVRHVVDVPELNGTRVELTNEDIQ